MHVSHDSLLFVCSLMTWTGSISFSMTSPETSTWEVPNDVGLTLPADSVYENGVVEVSLLYV